MAKDMNIDENGIELTIAAAIPTFRREKELIDTISYLLRQKAQLSEILVLDQSESHAPSVEMALSSWDAQGAVRWIKLTKPSIPAAMNSALMEARADVVAFFDDDIVPQENLISAHLTAHGEPHTAVVAGRIIQPWQIGVDFSDDETFHFASMRPRWIEGFMGGNFSVRREVALRLGGFDENFVRVAYNFEAEFSHRLRRNGYRIYFEPKACVYHLKAPRGGTRIAGDHLTTWRPNHAVGAYYCALRTKRGLDRPLAVLRRLVKAVATRHHLQKPWWIPATLTAEVLGLVWALALASKGPNYVGAKPGQKQWQ
jgi:GT2 family glycosyltransferase